MRKNVLLLSNSLKNQRNTILQENLKKKKKKKKPDFPGGKKNLLFSEKQHSKIRNCVL
jgi:hypothetical protein